MVLVAVVVAAVAGEVGNVIAVLVLLVLLVLPVSVLVVTELAIEIADVAVCVVSDLNMSLTVAGVAPFKSALHAPPTARHTTVSRALISSMHDRSIPAPASAVDVTVHSNLLPSCRRATRSASALSKLPDSPVLGLLFDPIGRSPDA